MIGKTISHYKITEKLGGGGMGVVYKAEDTRLGRSVALKFLPENLSGDREALERFRREARAASALNHPHICVIHDIGQEQGQHFIVMELLDGATLRSVIAGRKCTLREIIDLALQIVGALEEAHSEGIVHCDIKPANIFVDDSMHAKILDFGLAKLAPNVSAGDMASSGGKSIGDFSTNLGVPMGTLGYMSPEQARGRKLDRRTDLFSFGVVLYELCTGQPAFSGETSAVVYDAILNRTPPRIRKINPNLPAELERIVNKALEKDVDLRYQSAADLRSDIARLKRDVDSGKDVFEELETLAAETAPILSRRNLIAALAGGGVVAAAGLGMHFWPLSAESIESIAVLPFANLTDNPSVDYVCDRLTEGVSDSLAQLPDLFVLPKLWAARYKGASIDSRKVKQALKVHAVLKGRVVRTGDRLSVLVELSDLREENQLWSNPYQLDAAHMLPAQEAIARDSIHKLRPRLDAKQQGRLATYEVYEKGRYYLGKRTKDGLEQAIAYFQQVIQQDSLYALAHAGLADCYNLLPIYSDSAPKDSFPKAKKEAMSALNLDDALAEAHTALAMVKVNYERDWSGAEEAYKRAIELNTDYATAHQWYGEYLTNMGRFDDAILQMKQAQELAPLALVVHATLGWVFYYAHRSDEAIAQLRDTLKMDESFPLTHLFLGWAYHQRGDSASAVRELRTAVSLDDGTLTQASLAFVLARSGAKAEALQILKKLTDRSERGGYVSQYQFAIVYAGLDDRDKAIEALNRGLEERPWELVGLKVDPLLAPLRGDPRFLQIVGRLGLKA
jgi:eukaryotic-like serine/threonine-protein kinase